jgi:7-cyano-7-deazaguanine synthase
MKTKAVVLLSAGLDSSVNLFEAAQKNDVVLALTFNYGQKAATSEIRAAGELCKFLKINHKVIELPFFKDFNKSSLIVDSEKVPTGDEVRINNMKISLETAKSVWVPNRNGIFLNIAAGFAEALGAEVVIPGFNAEEAQTFPDNTGEYMDSLSAAFAFSTSNKVKVHCYTVSMNKVEIVKHGQSLQLPFEKIWPCYFSGDKWCGECESCQRSKSAMKAAGMDTQKYFKVN